MLRTLSLLAATLTLAGCASLSGMPAGATHTKSSTGIQRVIEGTVLSVRDVQVQREGASETLGTGVGGFAGYVLGRAVGEGKGKTLAGVGGAVAGAVAGNAAGKALNTVAGLDITVRLANGELRQVTQEFDGYRPAVGERVGIVTTGSKQRVTPL